MKRCCTCKQELPLGDFNKDKQQKDGLRRQCKGCIADYAQRNREKIAAKKQEYYQKNKEELDAYKKEWVEKNREYVNSQNKAWREKNPESAIASRQKYYQENKEVLAEINKKWYEDHKNTEEFKENRRTKRNQMRKSNIQLRLGENLRRRLLSALKGTARTGSAVRDLGCSVEHFVQHLESQFQDGMSWDNYGYRGWHIDHIVPISHFDLTDPKQLLAACHYTNLQPLWAIDNFRKNDSLEVV